LRYGLYNFAKIDFFYETSIKIVQHIVSAMQYFQQMKLFYIIKKMEKTASCDGDG